MTESEAITLIEGADLVSGKPQKWADLGCGSGLFTCALASLLPDGSRILAVDKTRQGLIRSPKETVNIEFLQTDFTTDSLPITDFDGVLMANSLHYVKDKQVFIQQLKSQLGENSRLIIIEYDTMQSNTWVPYPVSFDKCKELFNHAGYPEIRKIGERPSRYGYKRIYACEIRKE